MRKAIVLMIGFVFLVSNNIQASFFAPNFNPYSFGPQGRSVADLRDFAKPKQMANILAGRPVVATKQDGTRVYYSSDGKLCLSIKQNGEMSFSLGGHSLNLDKNGNLVSETKTLKGNFQEVRNEFKEITGYNQLDGHGKIIASYDKDKNKTIVYNYGKYGASLESSINLMNGQKTVYDSYERAMAVYDPDGYILTSYQYEDISYEVAEDRKTLLEKENKDKGTRTLVSKKDYSHVLDGIDQTNGLLDIHNACITTYYDKKGLPEYIVGADGLVSTVYHYNKDAKGNKVLQYVLDVRTKEKTYYENNRQIYVLNNEGAKIREFYYNGNEYWFSAELDNDGNWLSTTDKEGVTTAHNIVYDKDKQIRVRSEKGKIIEKYFYRKDSEGNNILDYIENVIDDTRTYFDDDGCATKTVDSKGNVIMDYAWNDKRLIYSFNRETGITTWYDGEGSILYKALDEVIISKEIRDGGQLSGRWNLVQGTNVDENGNNIEENFYDLSIYVNETFEFTLRLKEEPTLDQVRYIKNTFMNTGVMATGAVYGNNGNKKGEWEYIKRKNDEQKGMAEMFYKLKIYKENGDSFVVEYKGDPKDRPTEEIINEYLVQHQNGNI